MVRSIPILLDPSKGLFRLQDYYSPPNSDLGRSFKGSRFLPSLSTNFSFSRTLNRLREDLLRARNNDFRILILGSGIQRPRIYKYLNTIRGLSLIALDVDSCADVDIIADAHTIPFADESFDAVITTAVLEHVLDPSAVVSEIFRILAPNGLVYSELPFMQQVHEGAYDFTRYTMLGHCYLFRYFKAYSVGPVAGPGSALAWCLEFFALSFVPSRLSKLRFFVKAFSRLLFFWIKYFDYILLRFDSSYDALSCTYFYGCKSKQPLEPARLISSYVGGATFKHF